MHLLYGANEIIKSAKSNPFYIDKATYNKRNNISHKFLNKTSGQKSTSLFSLFLETRRKREIVCLSHSVICLQVVLIETLDPQSRI